MWRQCGGEVEVSALLSAMGLEGSTAQEEEGGRADDDGVGGFGDVAGVGAGRAGGVDDCGYMGGGGDTDGGDGGGGGG
eukprot:54843-Pleurochrysis_carterae.AAC.1